MNFIYNPIHTYENLLYRNNVKSFSIYLVVLTILVVALALLPIIKVDISTQGRGIIRSEAKPVIINIANARVEWVV